MKHRYLISGGGTGGHIFPALAIADKIRKENPDSEILFIGAQNKMEMTRVPDAGYSIKGINIYGISRSFSFHAIARNLKLPFVLLKSIRKARQIIKDFKPDVAIGVGGFASFSALKAANRLHIPTLLQEQNSYAGITNRMLARNARTICVAYNGMERFFPAEKMVKTGNPIRADILNLTHKDPKVYKKEMFKKFSPDTKTVLVIGGSQGARTLNETMAAHIEDFKQHNLQLYWQTGYEYYKNHETVLLKAMDENKNVLIVPFIKNMNDAYSIADIIISRAGALAIAELAVVGVPAIMVPYPYAAEDHQTGNAKALTTQDAAILIPDNRVSEDLLPQLFRLVCDEERCVQLSQNILTFAQPDAIDLIYEEIRKICD